MKRNITKVSLGIAILVLFLFVTGNAFSSEKMASPGESVTITGTVAAGSQIVDQDGQTYMLGENDQAKALSALIGTKVQLKGTVLEKESGKEISVSEYQVLTK